jgi:redox-sensitive bicupin YhaK (pirin superfamily)
VKIHADAKLLVTKLAAGESLPIPLSEGRYGWLQMAKGAATVNGTSAAQSAIQLHQGDGAGISKERNLTLEATEEAEVLLFDLA